MSWGASSPHLGYIKIEHALVTLEIIGDNNEGRTRIVDRKHALYRTNKAVVLDIEALDRSVLTGRKLDFRSSYDGFNGALYYHRRCIVKQVWNSDIEMDSGCSGIYYYLDRDTAIFAGVKAIESGELVSYRLDGRVSTRTNFTRWERDGTAFGYNKDDILVIKQEYSNGKEYQREGWYDDGTPQYKMTGGPYPFATKIFYREPISYLERARITGEGVAAAFHDDCQY